MNRTGTRQSNFELMRLVSMYLIISYHIFRFIFEADHPEIVWYKAIQMPIHVGVPLFVMISGYFGIKFSFRSMLGGVMSKLYVLSIPIAIYSTMRSDGTFAEIVNSFFVIGHNKFWFVNTYLCLYFIAPALNLWFDSAKTRQQWILLGGLLFFSIYVGDFMNYDPALSYGKNLLNFVLLYLIGRTLYINKNVLLKISLTKLVWFFFFIISIPFIMYIYVENTDVREHIWTLCFPYNSPILLFESCILLVLFGNIKVQSDAINWAAKSVFALYILHVSAWGFIVVFIRWFERIIGDDFLVIIASLFFVFVIMTGCIIIDKSLSPIWNQVSKLAKPLDDWYWS